MRTRVLLPLLVFGLLTVCAILVPAGESIAAGRTQQLVLQRSTAMDQIVQRSHAALADNDPAALVHYLERFHDTYGERVLVVDSTGSVIAAVGGLRLDPAIAELALAASRTVPQWSVPTIYPWSSDTALVAEPLLSGGNSVVGAVVLEINQTTARRDVGLGWLLAGAVGAALLALLLGASVLWTRWILRPVHALDAATRAVAEQRQPDLRETTGPPELRRLADSFARMARGVADALEQQRGLVADASHQLRNPLAAIRLRVDELRVEALLAGTETDASPELDAMERDLDRLEHTVERMLVLAEAEHRATEVTSGEAPSTADAAADPVCVASAAGLVAGYRDRLQSAGVELVAAGDEQRISCRSSDLAEMVEILLDNAGKYAGRGATVWVSLDTEPTRDVVTLEVADSGPGLSDEELGQVGSRFWRAPAHNALPGTGLGYAIIQQLARANLATVEVDRSPQGGLRTRIRMRAA